MLFSGNHFVITQFNVFQGGDGHGEVDDEYCFLGTMLSLLNSIYPRVAGGTQTRVVLVRGERCQIILSSFNFKSIAKPSQDARC